MAWRDRNFTPVFPEKKGEKSDATRHIIYQTRHEQPNPRFALLASTAKLCPAIFYVACESN
jgi:hypothetical protein